MQVKQLRDAKPYEAPNHRGYCSLRLFGLDAGGPKQFTVGLSYFLPGGGAGPDASPTEKVYYVLVGRADPHRRRQETVLRADDSCFIGPNESREIINRGNEVVHHAGGGVDAAEVMHARHVPEEARVTEVFARTRSRCSTSAARPRSSPAPPARSGRSLPRCSPAPAPMS